MRVARAAGGNMGVRRTQHGAAWSGWFSPRLLLNVATMPSGR